MGTLIFIYFVLTIIGAIIAVISILAINNISYKDKINILNKKIKKLEQELLVYNNNVKYEPENKENLKVAQNSYTSYQKSKNIVEKNTVTQNVVKKDIVKENITKEPVYKTNNQNTNTAPKAKKKNDEGIKNKFILITGAILIVLAAIVFLTSTWHTIPDVVKTSVIMFLVFVFLGASNIASNILKLKETGNTFLYIAMAYLPISLFSIALFGLLGDYLSIYGEGRNLYFAICTTFLAILYFMIGKVRNQRSLFNFSMIMQAIAVIWISLCFKSSFNAVLLGFVIYNILLTLFKPIFFEDYIEVINIYSIVYIILIFAVEVLTLIFDIIFERNELIYVIICALSILNSYLLCRRFSEGERFILTITMLVQFLMCVFSAINLSALGFNLQIKELVFFFGLILMYFYGILEKRKEWKYPSIFISLIAMIFLYVVNIFMPNEDLIIKNYMILWILTILCIIGYNVSKNCRWIFINLIPIIMFIAQIDTILTNSLNINYILYVSIGVFIFSTLRILKDKQSNIILEIYANVLIILTLIICTTLNYYNLIDNTLNFVLVMVAYIFAFIKNQKIGAYKIASYFISNIVLYSILNRYNLLQYGKYIVFVTTIAITTLESIFKKLENYSGKIYLIVSYIMTFRFLNFEMDMISFLVMLATAITFSLYLSDKKLNSKLNIISLIALIPSVYLLPSQWATFGKINTMIFVNLCLVYITTMLSLKKEKINVYTILSGVYILLGSVTLDFSIYFKLIIALIWSVLHLMQMPKLENTFKVITYVISLILYNNLIKDISQIIGITVTALNFLGYIMFIILITRNILKDYLKIGYKVIEYIALSLLYIIAIFSYNSQIDGMIFVLMLLTITIGSYINKYGPVFFTSIIAITINGFLLTREFWFSIPWWAYMLTIGSALILFAIRNELNENKQKGLIKSKIKSFKDFIDM